MQDNLQPKHNYIPRPIPELPLSSLDVVKGIDCFEYTD